VLSVVTPAATRDLIRLEDVRAALSITDRAEDEQLAQWISQASGAIERFCGRVYAKETVQQTERINEYSELGIILDRTDINDIVSVSEIGNVLTSEDYELDGRMLYRLSADERVAWAVGKVVIVYMAGFSIDDVPEHIRRAVIVTVNHYRLGTDRDPQLRSESTDGAGSSSYFDGLDEYGLSPEVRGLLKEERRPMSW
jgi:hypothetical protein